MSSSVSSDGSLSIIFCGAKARKLVCKFSVILGVITVVLLRKLEIKKMKYLTNLEFYGFS